MRRIPMRESIFRRSATVFAFIAAAALTLAQGADLPPARAAEPRVIPRAAKDEKDKAIGIICQPKRKARLAVNDARDRICPEPLAPWYLEKAGRLDVRQCYLGENVWMGPFMGKLAHGGLDLNMKSGTQLFAPIGFDDHYYFNSLAAGHNNNRWRGVRRWPDGSVWWLQSHHLNKLLVPEHTPLKRGQIYAESAGVFVGARQHTHFAWRITEQGEDYWLDPWILFWQAFQDQTPSLPDARPRSDRFRCGGRESKFLAVSNSLQ
jgi:hypothetical protein